jgi:hypothetical protein
MTRVVTESTAAVGAINAKRSDQQEKRERIPGESGVIDSLEAILRPEEKELLRELVHDLRTIRYGSIVLVMHEGRLVEISKTVRIRKSFTSEVEKAPSGK